MRAASNYVWFYDCFDPATAWDDVTTRHRAYFVAVREDVYEQVRDLLGDEPTEEAPHSFTNARRASAVPVAS